MCIEISVGPPVLGWKDAPDAVVYPDASQVTQLKALCELQGYVFDTRMRTAEVFEALGKLDSPTLRRHAAALQLQLVDR
jgi:hypothetical protein